MTTKIRSITSEESQVLDRWQRADSVVGYRRTRILRLGQAHWKWADIASVLGVHVDTVRQTITQFNEGGIPVIAPGLVQGQLSAPVYTTEVAQSAEALVRQGLPSVQDQATWTLHDLSEAIAAYFDHIASISHESVRRLLGQRKVTYRRAKEWLTSPDPFYGLRKHHRDRLLTMARNAPDGAAVWLDHSWFVRWPY